MCSLPPDAVDYIDWLEGENKDLERELEIHKKAMFNMAVTLCDIMYGTPFEDNAQKMVDGYVNAVRRAEKRIGMSEYNCRNCFIHEACGCGGRGNFSENSRKDCYVPEPDLYYKEHAELTQALERACEAVSLNEGHRCPIERGCWSDHDCLCGDEACIKKLIQYFKEAVK